MATERSEPAATSSARASSADELCYLPASEQARLIAAGELSPVDLVDAYLVRIERLNPTLNAYLTIDADGARAAAHQAVARRAREHAVGPLHGVPIALKDLYATRGLRTTAGSKVLRDWVPDEDAETVARLRAAGAIVLGKLHTTEFATSPLATNDHFGTCRNPWNPERNPGGSSSGSAAAIAAGLASATLGSDTGGSIRIPAALCGVVGLKPTYGRVSRRGVVPLAWTLDHAGPLTRTVRDAALVLAVIAGHDAQDPASGRVPVPNYVAALDGDVRKLRIGVPQDYFFKPVEVEVADAVHAAIATLVKLGAKSVPVHLPVLGTDALRAPGLVLSSVELAAAHHDWHRDRPDDYGPFIRKRLNTGATILATDYVKLMRARSLWTAELERVWRDCDVLVAPTTPRTATDFSGDRVTVDGVSLDVRAMLARLTRPFNMSGSPAIAVPCGFGADGLPISLQIAGPAYAEALVLKVGDAYERATDWHTRRPDL